MTELKPCPVCGGTKYELAGVFSIDGHSSLVVFRKGSIRLKVCLTCGNVSIEDTDIDRIRRSENG